MDNFYPPGIFQEAQMTDRTLEFSCNTITYDGFLYDLFICEALVLLDFSHSVIKRITNEKVKETH